MNFKPNLWKMTISLLIGLIGGIYFSKMYYTGLSGPSYVFSIFSVISFFVLFILVYIIWSLFEKKSRK